VKVLKVNWKRCLDVIAASVGLVVLSPLIGAIAAGILLCIGWPVFFTQSRPGLQGRPFRIKKFRSISTHCGPEGEPLPDAVRLTGFGRFLRNTSLDELPELWNVLRGDMSLVGPRPLLMEYLPLYTSRQLRRHEVRPGMTGWAQVNGRNALSWEERFELDLWYVEHQSPGLDLKVLWLTMQKVLTREGISHAGDATMPKFTGSAR
jgi:lipopolysaccharide/colanic/teichoic acid biosynthesis glycosyltransferase